MSDYKTEPGDLTFAEQERLHLLIEECAEVQKRATKTLRYGWEDKHPEHPEDGTNRHRLATELGHLLNAANFLLRAEDVPGQTVAAAHADKAATIYPWLCHQPKSYPRDGKAHSMATYFEQPDGSESEMERDRRNP